MRISSKTRSHRCPRCQFQYAWDGRFCEHCHYPHAKRTNWDEFRQLARFPYAHPDPNPRALRLFGCACLGTVAHHLPPEAEPIVKLLEREDQRSMWQKAVLQANDLFTRLPDGPSASRDSVRLLAILAQMLGGAAESDSAIAYLIEPLTPAMLGSVAQPSELRQMMFQFAHQVAQMHAHLQNPHHPAETAEMPEFLSAVVRRWGWNALNNVHLFTQTGTQPNLSAAQAEEAIRYREARQFALELTNHRRDTIAEIEAHQCDLYRDLFGYPFVAIELPLACRTRNVRDLALSMLESRDFRAMPILGDALMDAGCEEGEIIAHCRLPKPHTRGCWLLNLILDEGSESP